MAVFQCKMCGASLNVDLDQRAAVCTHCETMQTLPRLTTDRKTAMFERANQLRRNNEYDKAEALYEQLLTEDSTDAETYWSLVLCRYGVEYVKDPVSRRHVPTVNRVQYTSIFDDANFKAAMQHADATQRQVYQKEAEAINEIQKGFLDISRKETPFDVFICYKETDEHGRRTPDSVLATELYHQLTREGLKVFFARITLEDKLGTAYEPYIFAALNSASVMVVLGTRPEYFQAVWVKNEWSRYLALIRDGGNKILIPAYKDMEAYDLPEEFSHLQAQDMSRLGFMQDLIHAIRKLTQAQAEAKAASKESPLVKRAFIALEDGEFERADEFCETVLDADPENAHAYLGKLMVKLRVRTPEQIADTEDPLDDDIYYKRILRFGDEEIVAKMTEYNRQITERGVPLRKKHDYEQAMQQLSQAKDAQALFAAAELFKRADNYLDAQERYAACMQQYNERHKAEVYDRANKEYMKDTAEGYLEAKRLFTEVAGYRYADNFAKYSEEKYREALLREQKRPPVTAEQREQFQQREQQHRAKLTKEAARQENLRLVGINLLVQLLLALAAAFIYLNMQSGSTDMLTVIVTFVTAFVVYLVYNSISMVLYTVAVLCSFTSAYKVLRVIAKISCFIGMLWFVVTILGVFVWDTGLTPHILGTAIAVGNVAMASMLGKCRTPDNTHID